MSLRKKLDIYIRLTRLNKPIGISLLLWPTLWALWIASNGQPDSKVLVIFILGTVLMRSAGCVMNDIADRNFDAHVIRTQQRPLATKEISVKEAALLAASLSFLAFLLVLQLNRLTILISCIALFLAASYPLTKRFLVMPQAYLGIAFGMGVPMAFAATQQQLPNIAWLMLLANVFWAIAYDTEYAMVDRQDDLKIGIKSSAIFFAQHDVLAIMVCYGAMLLCMALIGFLAQLSWPYYISLLLAACIAGYHYQLVKNRQPAPCFQAFLHNNWLGFTLFLGLLLSYLIK